MARVKNVSSDKTDSSLPFFLCYGISFDLERERKDTIITVQHQLYHTHVCSLSTAVVSSRISVIGRKADSQS